jgi:hypothetical protein
MNQFESMLAEQDQRELARTLPPFVIDVRGGIAGRTWEIGSSIDVDELGRFFRTAQEHNDARSAVMRARIEQRALSMAVERYMVDHDGKPPAKLEALVERDASGQRYFDRDELPVDPWGHAYVYTVQGATFRIASLGSDGRPGGTGDAADIE